MGRGRDGGGNPLDETRLREALGNVALPRDEFQEFAASLLVRHPSVLRCRRGVLPEQLEFPLAAIPWYALAYRAVDPAARPSRSMHFAAADYYLQDAGSLLALAACEADQTTAWWLSGDHAPLVCDLCAAPGGKATALVEMLDALAPYRQIGTGRGFVIANEPIHSRLPALTYNLARTGSDRYAITSVDPQRLAEQLPGRFDLVLVDAPCSGQALLSRGRQTSSAISPAQIEHAAARQRRILESAVHLLRPGGALVYSTCTFAEAENEAQARWLIESYAMEAVSVPRLAPHVSPLSEGGYRLWPHRDGTAGSFAAILRARGNSPDLDTGAIPDSIQEVFEGSLSRASRGNRSRRRPKESRSPPREAATFDSALLDLWLDGREHLRVQARDASVIGWPSDAPDWVESLATAGPELAHRTGRTWKPAHAAALRRVPRGTPHRRLDVDDQAVGQFLAGQPISAPERGWFVVCWRGRPLGWAKGDGKQAKNHLPAAARQSTPLETQR